MPDKDKDDFEDSAGSEGASHPPSHEGHDPFAEQRELAQYARHIRGQQHKAKLDQGLDATIPDL